MFFSDEKLFSVKEKLCSQNTRLYALAIENVPEEKRKVQRFQNESKIYVWCAISKKKGNIPMFFVEPGVKINAEYYIEHIIKLLVKGHSMKI